MKPTVYTIIMLVFLASCIDVPGTIVSVRYLNPDDSGDLWLMTMEFAQNVTNDIDVHENVSFGPDGMIYFSRQNGDDDLSSEIWKMSSDGSGQVKLTENAAVDFHPTVSPDNDKVVWWSSISGSAQLWIMDINGDNKTNLINDPDIWTFDPEFSPDGNMIAFNLSPDGGLHADIWVGVLDEYKTQFIDMWPVTNTGYVHTEVDPSWAPNGLTLAYSAYEGPGTWFIEGIDPFLEPEEDRLLWKIYLIDLDLAGKTGVNKRVLVEERKEPYGVSWLPCFSPDGEQVAFIRSNVEPDLHPGPYPFDTTSSRLRVINVDGTEDRPIANTEGCYFFDWVP